MDIKKHKQGFAFSFLALFISILIFAIGSLYLHSDNYSLDSTFNKARVSFIDSEIKYFKNVYLKNAIEFSTYNAITTIVNNKTILSEINQNYSKLNSIIYEAITLGEINSNYQPSMENKTISYFINSYKNTFKNSYKGNITYSLNKIIINENTPYYLTIITYSTFNITTEDNISSWNFKDVNEYTFPIFETLDPKFYMQGNLKYNIKSADIFSANQNFSYETFNETLTETYSHVYMEPEHRYTIGTSFLNRLLNISHSSYNKVIGFWSFDYDFNENIVYDSSLTFNQGKHFGNTILFYDFKNSSIIGSNIIDSSFYQNNGTNNGATLNKTNCLYEECFIFNGINNNIEISPETLNLNFSNSFSISIWVKPLNLFNNFTLFEYGSNNNEKISLRKNNSLIEFEIGNHSDSSRYIFSSKENLTLNSWNNVIATFNGTSGIGKIYVNGIYRFSILDNHEQTLPLTNFLKSSSNIFIGSSNTNSNHFSGLIDEVNIFSKPLTETDISLLLDSRKSLFIDYKDSILGTQLEFDGIDDSILIFNNSINPHNYSIELWFKPKSSNSISEGLLYLNGNPEKVSFYINNSKINVKHSSHAQVLSSNVSIGKLNYIIFTSDSTEISIYKNSKKINSLNLDFSISNLNQINVSYNHNSYFNGDIDEIKIYNRTLTETEIKSNYYNFNSNGKGCCNYITLINPNEMGYNNINYDDEVSYSSKLFYDYYNKGISHNLSLVNITNITSNEFSENYYNFLIDACLENAFNIGSFGDPGKVLSFVNLGEYNFSCSNLVSNGIY